MADFYVSHNGDDNNNGLTPSTAFRTSSKLMEVLNRESGVISYERGGIYDPLILFEIWDYGGFELKFETHGTGPKPIFSAFITPTWTNNGGNIWYYENIDFEDVTVLKINDINQPLGRTDFFNIDSFSGNNSITSSEISSLSNFVGGELVSKKTRWTIDKNVINNQTSDTITVNGDGRDYVQNHKIFIQKHINCLTEQNDWYYNNSEKRVYIYSEVNPNTLDINVSFNRNSLYCRWSGNLFFDGYAFEGSYEDCILIEHSENYEFDNCKISYAGRDGLRTFVLSNSVIKRSKIKNINNNGVNYRDITTNSSVLNCKIERIATILGAGQSGDIQYNGITLLNDENNITISGNYLSKIGNNGIYFRNNNILVENNYVEEASYLVGDAAGIYTFGNFNNPYENLICRNNISINCNSNNIMLSDGETRNDSCGFYFDDNSTNIEIYQNYSEKNGVGMYFHNASLINCHDNIIYNNDRTQVMFGDDNAQGVGSTIRIRNINFEGNKLIALSDQLVYETIIDGIFENDDPWDFGNINNNEIQSIDDDSYNLHLTFADFNVFENLEFWRNTTGHDINSNTFIYNPNNKLILINKQDEEQIFELLNNYIDWDSNNFNEGNLLLQPYESKILFLLEDFNISEISQIYERRHPIVAPEWSTVVPGDCQNGDNIGKVTYLWTHPDFYKIYWPYGQILTESSYNYQIVGGNNDNTFSIDNNGELTILNASNFMSTRNITVRVSVFPWYYNDCICTIRRIPVEDCVYFDINVGAGQGNGTRSNPYRSFRDRVSILENGTPGKSYFWRRGQTFTQEGLQVRNQDISNPYINFGAWGQGARPIIDISNSPISRFINIGINVTANTENQPLWEQQTAHNIRIFDLEFIDNNTSASRYPIQGNPYGVNWEIGRLKAQNTEHSNGFFWFIGTFFVGYINKNLKMYDIETSISNGRQVKFECGGVEAWNFKCYNNNTGNGALVSATTHPFVDLKYIHYTHENDNTTSLGMNLRARGHTVEYVVFDVTGWAMVLFNLASSEGQGSNYNIDDTCYFKNIIINRCGANSLNNSINGTTGNEINGAIFENIFSKAGKPFWVNDTAKNLKFRNCIITGTGTWGIRVWASSGDDGNPTIENCILLGFTNTVQCDTGKTALIRNSIYDGNLSGGIIDQNNNSTNISDFQDVVNYNYRLVEESLLIDAGIFNSDNEFDMVQVQRKSPNISLGAFEYIEEDLTQPINIGDPIDPVDPPQPGDGLLFKGKLILG